MRLNDQQHAIDIFSGTHHPTGGGSPRARTDIWKRIKKKDSCHCWKLNPDSSASLLYQLRYLVIKKQ